MLEVIQDYSDDDRIEINARHFKVVVNQNSEGLIVDVYGENALITTHTYWDMDEQPEPELIRVKDLVQTCGGCPSQWEATEVDTFKDVYIRYRWGVLTAQIGGHIVYSEVIGDSLDGILSTFDMKNELNLVEVE